MSAYNHDFRLLINAGLSHSDAKSIAEQTHWDRLKAEYDALREARRSGDTVRAGIARSNINAQYGRFGRDNIWTRAYPDANPITIGHVHGA